jgi:transposase
VRVSIGVDSHKSSFAAGAVDEVGRELDVKQFPNNRLGHKRALAWLRTRGDKRRIGIECSGSFGAGLARFLLEAGEDVREVPAALAHRERKREHAKGKSDPSDAVAIARVVAREEDLPSPVRSEVLSDLKLLSDYRYQLVCTRTKVANRVHKELVVIHPGYEKSIRNLQRKPQLDRVVGLIEGDRSVRAELIRRRISQLRAIDHEIAELNKQISKKLAESGSTLTSIPGVGPLVAARILGEVGEVSRVRSKAAFAQMAGAAPLPASSGVTKRHRLNRRGNRSLNFALHYMALAQYRSDPRARAYVERKREEGKSYKEAIRCLKRQLANVVYRQMVSDLEVAPSVA